MVLLPDNAFTFPFPSQSSGSGNERGASRASRAANRGEHCQRCVTGRGAILRHARFGRNRADRTTVPRRSRWKRAGRLCSGLALRHSSTVPQPRFFCTRNSVFDLGHRRKCRRVQLGRRDSIPSLPRRRPPGKAVCSCRNGTRRKWSKRPLMAGLPGSAEKLLALRGIFRQQDYR